MDSIYRRLIYEWKRLYVLVRYLKLFLDISMMSSRNMRGVRIISSVCNTTNTIN